MTEDEIVLLVLVICLWGSALALQIAAFKIRIYRHMLKPGSCGKYLPPGNKETSL
jgi:hypothetical protein